MIRPNKRKFTKEGLNLTSDSRGITIGQESIFDRNSNGITLIALIITIIVMLILVAVSVTIAIKGDLFGIAKKASKETEKAKNKEQELANGRIKIDGTWYDSFEDYVIGKASDVQGVVDLNEKNTKFIYTPEGWTNGEVKVEIEARGVAEGYSLKYSTDNANWKDYTGEIPIDANGPIYAKLVDSEGNEGGAITGNIKIDKEAPTINANLSKAGEETDTTIPLSINVTDSQSGISKIIWYYKLETETNYTPKEEIYKTMNGKEAGEKGAVTKETTIEGLKAESTYNIYAEVYDVAGNVTRSPAGTSTIDVTTKKTAVKPQIGDYVNYEPDQVIDNYKLLGKYSGEGSDESIQEISQEKLDWQILKIHDDRSIDLIGMPTLTKVYFQGALGYNNGVYLLHDICKELYSKPSQNIEARSVSLEDFEDEGNGGGWEEERSKYMSNGLKYGEIKTYTINTYYPNLYAKENGSGINTTNIKTDGINNSNKGYNSLMEKTSYSQASVLTAKKTYYTTEINEANYGKSAKVLKSAGKSYLCASRYAFSENDSVRFGLFVAFSDIGNYDMFYSNNEIGRSYNYPFRPVVTLKSDVILELSEEGTNSSSNPHKIIKY